MSDHMELGSLIPVGQDWWQDAETGRMYRLDEEGTLRDAFGNIIREVFVDQDEPDD